MRRVTAGVTWQFSFRAMARKEYSLFFRGKGVGMVHGVVKVISAVYQHKRRLVRPDHLLSDLLRPVHVLSRELRGGWFVVFLSVLESASV